MLPCEFYKISQNSVYRVTVNRCVRVTSDLEGLIIFIFDSEKVLTQNAGVFNPLSANHTKRLLPTNCLSVFDHFVGLRVKTLSNVYDGAVHGNSS